MCLEKESYDELGYVKAGKIFHLDGIDKGNTSGAWTDLVGGFVFTNKGSVSSTSNGWYFDGINSVLRCMNTSIFSANVNTTVEICLASTSATYCAFIAQFVNSVPLFYVNNSDVTFLQRQKTYTLKKGAGTHCYSYNLTNGCEDGVAVSPNSGIDYWNNNGGDTAIGARNGGAGARFNGTIYSIRVYNRRLSYAEMLHNQQVDNERFGLGLNLSVLGGVNT